MNTQQRQRIAVIGSGISGLASAHFLARRHLVTLFEANDYLGGHTHTVDVEVDGLRFAVDTGFLVYNERTYPNLIALFRELDIPSHPTEMSFSVSLDHGRLEWAGSNLDTVFAQRGNLLSAGFWGMLGDILRFNREAERNLARAAQSPLTLGELLDAGGYGRRFRDHYLLPMAAAIWSSPCRDILAFPAETFLRFCLNHGLLQIRNRPPWRTVPGGARQYVDKIAAGLDDIRLGAPVLRVSRVDGQARVLTQASEETFDAVVFATHAPQTLRLLVDADERERAVLQAVRYQPNEAVLHCDDTLLPRRRRAWAAWNFIGDSHDDGQAVGVSYLLNRLQPLPLDTPVIVTLNPPRQPAADKVLGRFAYQHPLLDDNAIAAQRALRGIQGRRACWFAGAWTGYGFHEDGLKSGLRVAADFGLAPDWARI
ncbi:NAD(P)/FAD-dependent oxidoreductase [Chromobacterium amazonense]|uniref:NAD(P)/FAD-dependent oxidoreductase n=1 Tax=Chromobacterium amazonense TaxID=1382803 RepID=UPI0005833EB4|nr:FAD-dependent oxidoreductase [Chromobacterium amazonense]KIA80934.1 NADH-ubiquinone oxidoreductase subunit 6 [Chromobacterium piscinae]MBM2885422.1 FAD-dependent oxidoreductase [Chromobacterium amazonense]MDE1715247.1 FAD-dependent oxidoreductase [Chromobacterium amazonense]